MKKLKKEDEVKEEGGEKMLQVLLHLANLAKKHEEKIELLRLAVEKILKELDELRRLARRHDN